MNKRIPHLLRTTGVIFLFLILSISGFSLPVVSEFTENQNAPLSQEQKITQILNMIDEDLVFEYLKTLVDFGPRMTGTYGCEKSAEYIYDQFDGMELNTRYHEWTSWGNYRYPHVYTSHNVEGVHPGTNPESAAIIFNSHYDTVYNTPGANDDGSGTAAVLAAAYALSQFDFERTIKFVTFSGEEIGLLGSQAYAKEAYQRNDRILVQVNADMIGYDIGSQQLRVTASEDAVWVGDVFAMISEDYPIGLSVIQGSINRVQHTLRGSDYSSFLLYGWECVACWNVDRDPHMHTPQDEMSNVNISYLVNTTRLIAASLAYLADVTETPPQVRITSPRFGYLYFDGLKKQQIQQYSTIVVRDFNIWAEVDYVSAPLVRAEFYYDGNLVHIATEEPFQWHCNMRSLGKHEIMVIVHDCLGRTSMDWREIFFIHLRIRK